MKGTPGVVAAMFGAAALLAAAAGGCSGSAREGFAIYLTKPDIPPAGLTGSNRVDLAEFPLISESDVIKYNAQTHELTLTPEGFKTISDLEVPVRGRSFVVCVDGKPIYSGAFWTPISSISFDGVTIWKPYQTDGPRVVTLELGYPSPSFYGGHDPRNDRRILDSLGRTGKLVDRISIEAIDVLPGAMKGYELYSWLENERWRFTLITGTDRNKTANEIVSNVDFISEAGFVKVTVTGAEAIESVLAKVPENETVIWMARTREASGQNSPAFGMPPDPTREAIKRFALNRGLDFQVQAW